MKLRLQMFKNKQVLLHKHNTLDKSYVTWCMLSLGLCSRIKDSGLSSSLIGLFHTKISKDITDGKL